MKLLMDLILVDSGYNIIQIILSRYKMRVAENCWGKLSQSALMIVVENGGFGSRTVVK